MKRVFLFMLGLSAMFLVSCTNQETKEESLPVIVDTTVIDTTAIISDSVLVDSTIKPVETTVKK